VTGAAGFVGSHLVRSLLAEGIEVTPSARRPPAPGFVELDVTSVESVRRAFEKRVPDAVVHLAALAHAGRGYSEEDYDRVNRRGTEIVVDAMNEVGIPGLVMFSTASVYGDLRAETHLTEEMSLAPIGPYAISKARAEDYAFARGPRMTSVLRSPAIYAANWLLNVRKRAYLPGTGNRVLLHLIGEPPAYSFCSVANAAAAAVALSAGGLAHGIYNLADPQTYPQPVVRAVIGELDGIRATLPFPAPVGRSFRHLQRLLPAKIGTRAAANIEKLFRGQTLSTERIEKAGFRPSGHLTELLSRPGRPASPAMS
jgi:nucleoside-diphosphate-sugar epimerase